jgi:hypothetical protein
MPHEHPSNYSGAKEQHVQRGWIPSKVPEYSLRAVHAELEANTFTDLDGRAPGAFTEVS